MPCFQILTVYPLNHHGNVLRLVILVVEQHHSAAGQDTGCGLLHITVMSEELLGIVPYWQHI